MSNSYLVLIFLALIIAAANPRLANAQDESLERTVQRIDSLRKANSVFRFGLSVGPRVIAFEKDSILERRNASISPADSTLQFESVDRFEIALAGVVSAYPFVTSKQTFLGIPLRGIGFLAKLNLADFGPDSFVVNRVIEGGLGFSLSLSREFSVGATLERVAGNRIRSNFEEEERVISRGEVLLELDPTNRNIFVSDNFTALSVSWIYSF